MSEFWNQKQIIVTGAMGMVGSRLCEFLRDAGAIVHGIDDQSRGTHRVDGVQYHVGDAGDYTEWPYLFAYKHLKPFAIFNLAAAVGGVYFNQKNHAAQFTDNLRLQTTPARIAAERNVPIFVQVSSVCVYSDDYNDPALEYNGHVGEPEPANAGYAWAKRMGERACEWAFSGTDTRWCIVRPTNMYGIRDYFDERAHVIPALIKKCLTLDKFSVWGGDQTREFLYADDGARGMMTVAEHGECGEVYNLGTSRDTQITIGSLARAIYELTGSNADVTIDCNTVTGDMSRCTDSSKAAALGWKYQVSLRDGLRQVIEWYKRRNTG